MGFYRTDAAGRKCVTLIRGDGIGPEVVEAAQRLVEVSRVPIAWDVQLAGAQVFLSGDATGVPRATLESIQHNRVVLKGPLETPIGFGEKSANVTLRKLFEMYGNVRPVRSAPGVPTRFENTSIDLVVVRENVEDLYAGIEHQQSVGVAQCLKLMSTKGCEKIVRLAFEVAVSEGRSSVHCATKANIMKLTEGLMKKTFERVSKEYAHIRPVHILVDNLAHQLVRAPEQFEVIVTSNMNGDIVSDLTSGLIGGLGFAPGANLSSDMAMFEAVHGTAPAIAGKDLANPTAMLLSTVMMLRHLDEFDTADRIENSIYVTLESGFLTRDVDPNHGVGTMQFTNRVIENLGRLPNRTVLPHRTPLSIPVIPVRDHLPRTGVRRLAGIDIFLECELGAVALGTALESTCQGSPLRLKMISNRGTQVYPPLGAPTDCVDHWRCRFVARDEKRSLENADVLNVLEKVQANFQWMHLEKLQEFDGIAGWTRAQGEGEV
jgi:isocitrate dehydrogenase